MGVRKYENYRGIKSNEKSISEKVMGK